MAGWPMTLEVDGGLIAAASPDSSGVRAFYAIPYAAPPVGERRWRAPASVLPWSDVRAVGCPGPDCPQPHIISSIVPGAAGMSEDCLTLNVWTPATTPAERLPVLVWSHGGAFLVGSGRLARPDGLPFVHHGIVVVSMNYRLGAFGFLSHPALSEESGTGTSGNYGLMDQIAALRWVRNNIAAFGGDPQRVTLMGHSAGAAAANVLAVSPAATGLLQRIIALGGSAMPASGENDGSPLPLATEERKGERFADALGTQSLRELRSLPADAIVNAGGDTIGEWAWNASIDGVVLPDTPTAILSRGEQNDVPLVLGWGTDEGATMASDSFGGAEQPFAATLDARFGAQAAAVRRLYAKSVLASDGAAKAALAGDGFIGFPSWSWAMAQAQTGRAPVYVSRFGYAPTLRPNWASVVPLLAPAGAFHGAQMPYVTGTVGDDPRIVTTKADHHLSAALMPYFVRFISAGDPNGAGAVRWPDYRPSDPRTLQIDADGKIRAGPDPDHDRLAELGQILAAAPGALRYRGMDSRGS